MTETSDVVKLLQYTIAKHESTPCEILLNKIYWNYIQNTTFSTTISKPEDYSLLSVVRCQPQVLANGGVIAMYVKSLEKQLLFKASVFIFKITLDITFRLELLM